MIYEEIPNLSDEERIAYLTSNECEKVAIAVLSAALYCEDEAKATEICLEHLKSQDEWVVRNSLTGLGHIARLHRNINFDIARIEEEIKENKLDRTMEGEVKDLRRDIRVYIVKYHSKR